VGYEREAAEVELPEKRRLVVSKIDPAGYDLRALLQLPWAYRLFGRLIGEVHIRQEFVREYVHPRVADRILDIGCGPATILDYLPAVDYVGFDMSAAYIASAVEHYGTRGAFKNKRLGRDEIKELGLFDIVLAQGVLHHLDDAEASLLLRLAHDSLKPGCRLVTFDGCYKDRQSVMTRFLLRHDRGHFVRTEQEYHRLVSTVFQAVKVSIRNDLLRIPYTHIIMECEKQ
jgi:SAM-dependent methyltransferase